MKYLISLGPIEYLVVDKFRRYLIKVGSIKYLMVESFITYLTD